MKAYDRLGALPEGRAGESVCEGTLVLEGGAWRGLYTVGVLDCLMLHDVNLRTTVGISAGGLAGMGYVSGQIGWGARIDLTYRPDRRYCGLLAYPRDHGITGFSYLFKELLTRHPIDRERFDDPMRRFLVGATNMLTGEIEYFEKGRCDILRAVQASATVPYVSRPVVIGGTPYLDGGCAVKIPYDWAKKNEKSGKIVVVKTRERSYRREEKKNRLARAMYARYPAFVRSFEGTNARFNREADELEAEERAGRVFIAAPSRPVTVSRFEGDMQKLGDLYWLGFHDMEARVDELKAYLGG